MFDWWEEALYFLGVGALLALVLAAVTRSLSTLLFQMYGAAGGALEGALKLNGH